MNNDDLATLYYLVGRFVGLLHKMGRNCLDEMVYCDCFRVRITAMGPHHREMVENDL